MLVDMTVDKGIEYKLRISSIVAYLSLIRQTLAFLCQVQTDGIYAGAVVVQRI